MAIDFKKIILQKYPDADMDRYRLQPGDIVQMPDGAVLLCKQSAIMDCDFYVLKRSLTFREFKCYRVSYADIPKISRPTNDYKIYKGLKWKVGQIVDDGQVVVYLYEECGPQKFYGFVLQSANPYYLHTGVYVQSPSVYYM